MLLTALLGLAFLPTAEAEETAKPKVYGLMFHSDHCASCEVLNPKIDGAKANLAGEPVLFVTFDHTDDTTTAQAAMLASALGLADVYGAQEKASGFMLLVDAESGEVRETLVRDMSEEDIETTIRATLGG